MTVLLQGVVGSTAYGLATPSSDIDRLGFYCASTEDVLGLDGRTVVDTTLVEKAPLPDRTLHELGKYVSLGLKGNPTILELLWLEKYEISHYDGRTLIAHRDMFLSKQLAKTYGGYVLQQAKRLETRWRLGQQGFDPDLAKRTPKHGRHCYRLLLQGAQLLSQGTMNVRLDEQQRDECFAAGKLADSDPEAFKEMIEKKMRWFDDIAENSSLPEQPDRARANEIVVNIRYGF